MSASLRRIRQLATALCVFAVVANGDPASAYLKLGVSTSAGTVALKWTQMPVRYYISDCGVPGVSPLEFRAAVDRAFATWQAVPTASVTYEFAGFTGARPLEDDGASTLGFVERPDLDRVLGSTEFLVDTGTGELLEADIFFNAAFPWSTASTGESGRYDVESVAVHEIGHLSGLGHSALGESELQPGGSRRVIAAASVMFPIAFPAGSTAGRSLQEDDRSGISDVYPDGQFRERTGSVTGRVTVDGRGVLGSHVVAFDLASGALVGGFSLDEHGTFSIAGLSPGPRIIRVEPLDDADLNSFFDAAVDIDFRVRFFDRLVVVPPGGDSGPIEVEVRRK
jgi:hypothetical protein